jgi:hypothetical protein
MKNTDGKLGPICGYCGGYGFTNSLAPGTSAGCARCGGSGIDRERQLEERLQGIERRLALLEGGKQ